MYIDGGKNDPRMGFLKENVTMKDVEFIPENET